MQRTRAFLAFFVACGALLAAFWQTTYAVAPTVLTGVCHTGNFPKVELSWQPVAGATTNALQKGDFYPNDPNRYWDFLFSDTPPFDTYTYTDTNVQPNTVYEYRVKTDANIASNVFRCDTTPASPPPAPTGAPIVTTLAANTITQTSAAIRGSVNANGLSTQGWFEYGPTNTLGLTTAPEFVGSEWATYTRAKTISGLTPGTTYYYRFVAENEKGKTMGSITTVTTTALPDDGGGNPPPPPPPPPDDDDNGGNGGGGNPPPPQAVTTDIKADGSNGPITIAYAKSAQISWTSTGASSCSVQPANWTGFSGSRSTGNLTQTTTYTITCTGAGGNASDSVTVGVGSPPLPPVPTGAKPTVQTFEAIDISKTLITVKGIVQPNNRTASAWFEYGTTRELGKTTSKRSVAVRSTPLLVTSDIAVEPEQEYFYRIVAENSLGRSYGEIKQATASGDPRFTIEPNERNVRINERVQFRAYYDADGAGILPPDDVTTAAVWISSNAGVITHIEKGVFEGRGLGEGVVIALYGGPTRQTNINDPDNLRTEGRVVIGTNEPDFGQNTQTNESSSGESRGRSWLTGILWILILIAAAVGGWYGWKKIKTLREEAM